MKKIVYVILSLSLIISMSPMAVFAEDIDVTSDNVSQSVVDLENDYPGTDNQEEEMTDPQGDELYNSQENEITANLLCFKINPYGGGRFVN